MKDDLTADLEDISIEAIDEDIKAGPERKHPKLVVVTVDGKTHRVRRGRYVVQHFKRLVGVDPAYQLDQVVAGEFKPLDDHDKLVIHGDEVFVSHVRGGAAS